MSQTTSVLPTTSLPPFPPGPSRLQALQSFLDPLQFLDESVQRYGNIVRLDHTNYLINGAHHIEYVLVAAQQTFVRAIYDNINEAEVFWGNGLITSPRPTWLHKRRQLQQAFQHEYLIPQSFVIIDYATRMCAQWQDGSTHDLYQDMLWLSFHIAVRNILGIVPSEDTEPLWNALNATWKLFEYPAQLHIGVSTPAKAHFKRSIQPMDALVYRIIAERRASGRNFGDTVSRLLLIRDQHGNALTDDEIRDEIVMMLRSHHKNSSTNLAWLWHALAQHPSVQATLAAEVHDVLKGRLPTLQDLPQLQYTAMVVNEVLRLYPLYPTLTRRATCEHTIGGYRIPAGATVVVSAWLMHRDPSYFTDPTQFNPRRWETDLEHHLPRFAFFPFGGGPHQCLVKSYAIFEVMLVAAIMIQKFQLTHVPGHVVQPHISFNGMRPKNGVKVLLHTR